MNNSNKKASSEPASVPFIALETLWFNTGSICNLSCDNCFMESSPSNDRLSFITLSDLKPILRQALDECSNLADLKIGFTGGEPFLNPDIISLVNEVLDQGLPLVILTNGFRSIKRHHEALIELRRKFGDLLRLRISLDHFSQEVHEKYRGKGSFLPVLNEIAWLQNEGFNLSVAGRLFGHNDEAVYRRSFQEVFDSHDIKLDSSDESHLTLFSEMDEGKEATVITDSCWGTLGKSPSTLMCSNQRMVLKKKGEDHIRVVACTLIPYEESFSLGGNLKESFLPVKLNHPYCAQFCVLGGSNCSS